MGKDLSQSLRLVVAERDDDGLEQAGFTSELADDVEHLIPKEGLLGDMGLGMRVSDRLHVETEADQARDDLRMLDGQLMHRREAGIGRGVREQRSERVGEVDDGALLAVERAVAQLHGPGLDIGGDRLAERDVLRGAGRIRRIDVGRRRLGLARPQQETQAVEEVEERLALGLDEGPQVLDYPTRQGLGYVDVFVERLAVVGERPTVEVPRPLRRVGDQERRRR